MGNGNPPSFYKVLMRGSISIFALLFVAFWESVSLPETSSAEDEISAILNNLRDASETVLRNNADIDAIKDELKPKLVTVKGTAYFCEEMMSFLQDG